MSAEAGRQPPVYATAERLFPLLGIPEEGRSSILHELAGVCRYANSYADRAIRAKLGRTNSAGNPIILPLTETTTPPLTENLLQNIYRLAEAYFRFRQADDPALWDDATAKFEESIDEEFGYTWHAGYVVEPAVEIDPNPAAAGDTVRLSGTHFRGTHKIEFVLQDEPRGLRFAPAVTDSQGAWRSEGAVPDPLPTDGLLPGVGYLCTVTCSDGDQYVEGEARSVSSRLHVRPTTTTPADENGAEEGEEAGQ